MRKPLPADIGRCSGKPGELICEQCARQVQMKHDDEGRWYPGLNAYPVQGRCMFHIREESDHA